MTRCKESLQNVHKYLHATSAKTETGGVDGFKIDGMRRGEMLVGAGLRNDDVVTHINGSAVVQLTDVLSVWTALLDDDARPREVTLQVRRQDTPVTLTVELHDAPKATEGAASAPNAAE